MKKLLALLLTLMLSFSAFAGAGCRGEAGSNDPNTLEVYCYVQGFGSVWLEGTIDLFKQQDWVKEKYPDLQIVLETDSVANQAGDRLYNQKNSYTDIFFGSYQIDKIDPSYLVNLTENVYLTEVPGQPGDLIMDRVHPLAKDALYEPDYGKTTYEGVEYPDYYGMKYVSVFFGWMYNKTLFDKYKDDRGWQVPVTTEEMFNICDDIKENGYDYTLEGKTYTTKEAIMLTAVNGGYSQHQFPMYWAQYEGLDQYEAYYNGLYYPGGNTNYEGITSNKVLEQKGRLRSLETIEETQQNYSYTLASETTYLDGQGKFLSGTGMFHWNGDYFTTEMQLFRDAMRAAGTDYEIQMFACPVISSLVEKLSFYKNEMGIYTAGQYNGDELPYESFDYQAVPYKTLTQDQKNKYDAVLAAIVREIDAGATWETAAKSYNGYEITEEDWNIVYQARNIKGNRSLSTQAAVIPATTPAKELACDFMRFFYTDAAIENYGVWSKGLSFPVLYYENLSEEEYETATSTFEPEAKTKYDMFFRHDIQCAYIPANTQYLFGKFGLKNLKGYNGNMNQDFISKNAGRYTALNMFEMDIKYWQGDFWDAVVRQVESAT